MGFFNFGKSKEENTTPKETTCSCGGNCEGKENKESKTSKIIVLGACCKKSSTTFENVKIAVSELGLNEEVTNIGDVTQIAQYGVMSTPALVINNKVMAYGKLIKVEEAKKLIEKSGITNRCI